MNRPFTVDVIIPTYKPDEKLTKLVAMLQQQTYPVDHILIMNTEEELWDPDLIEDKDRVEVFHIPKKRFDHGGTRREGEGFSDADILVYMTQDAVPADRTLIRYLLRPFQNPQVKASYARQLPDEDCRIIEGYTRSFNYPEKSRVKGLEIYRSWESKLFSALMYVRPIRKKFIRNLAGLWKKRFLTRI